MLASISIDVIEGWEPCDAGLDEALSPERLRELFGGDSITPLEAADLPIPVHPRLWILLRPEVLGDKAFVLTLCDIADHVLPIFQAQFPDDDRMRSHINRIRGRSHEPLSDVQSWKVRAAYAVNAAWNAVEAATWNAAGEPVKAAARAVRTAHAVAVSVEGTGFDDGEGLAPAHGDSPAGDAEGEWQIGRVRHYLERINVETGQP